MADSLWYPSVEDAVAIHDDVVAEYPDTPDGVQNRGDIEFALNYVEEGEPRLSAGNHPPEGVFFCGSSSLITPSPMRTNVPRST